MEYFAIFVPSAEISDADKYVFQKKEDALKAFKSNKDARMKSFKSHNEALKFAKNGSNTSASSTLLESLIKSPPPNQPPMRSLEKSNFPSLKSQDLVQFRKEIEQNNVQKVYEMIFTNPRYLVSSGDTPSILKEGPRYNALHIAAMKKHAKMAKLILQTVEQPQFIELLHGCKNDPNVIEMSQFLLESYLNTPDKSRNDTPLHFAVKVGALDVVEVLISYPLCKMKQNSEGKYPKDVICDRAADTSPEEKKAIEELLKERYFVPVLRSNDSSVQPSIGEAFTPANMPKFSHDPLSPAMEIKAYAGPMTSEQAQTFRKRWKTPPRMVPTMPLGNHNTSFSPKSSLTSSPAYHGYSPSRMSKSLTELISSTPKHKKKLFDIDIEIDNDQSGEIFLDNVPGDSNGNVNVTSNGVLRENEEDEYKEIFDDLLEDKLQLEMERKENMFRGYRNPQQEFSTPIRFRNDPNSNVIGSNGNSKFQNSNDSMFCNVRSGNSTAMAFWDESGSIYNSDNICNSPSFKEKNIRLTDMEKGLEQIGRDLASEYNVGWSEFWTFLGRYLNIRSDQGLGCFEEYLKQKQSERELSEKAATPPSPSKKLNDSFGLGAVCAGLYSMDLNDEISEKSSKLTKNGLLSPSTSISRQSLFNGFLSRNSLQNSPLANPHICIEQSFRAYSKRLTSLLESETIQDEHSYEKMLLQEVTKLNGSIENYKRDMRFNKVNFQKVHARYSFLLVWYLKKNNIKVKYLRNVTPLISKVYALASQFATPNSGEPFKDASKSHAVCISRLISSYIEKQEKIFDPENVDTETACISAWNGPDIVECQCSLGMDPNNSKQRREIRKKLYSVDLWAARTSNNSDEEDSYLSCSDSDSDSDEFFTPPQSPSRYDSDDDDDLMAFEESLEHIEEEKQFLLFIEGVEPMKIDSDVYNALGDDFSVDETKYPLVSKWYSTMKVLSEKKSKFPGQSLKPFRIYSPKLKLPGAFFNS